MSSQTKTSQAEPQTPQQEPEGMEILFAENNQPFATITAAQAEVLKRRLSPKEWVPRACAGGFLLVKVNEPEAVKNLAQTADRTMTVIPEKYYVGIFNARRDKSDQEKIPISVNGTSTFQIEREVEVILPGYIYLAAQLAKQRIYKQKAGQALKEIGWIDRYPFRIVREATRAEFTDRRNLTPRRDETV